MHPVPETNVPSAQLVQPDAVHYWQLDPKADEQLAQQFDASMYKLATQDEHIYASLGAVQVRHNEWHIKQFPPPLKAQPSIQEEHVEPTHIPH